MDYLPSAKRVTYNKRPANLRIFDYKTIADTGDYYGHYVKRYEFTDAEGGKTIKQKYGTKEILLPYQSHLIASHDTLFIVEGEKVCLWINHYTDYTAITWAGGCSSWDKTSWSWLRGKRIELIPDNDDGGWKCMQQLGQYLKDEQYCEVFLVAYDRKSKDPAWDVADLENGEEFEQFYQSIQLQPFSTGVVLAQPITADDDKHPNITEQFKDINKYQFEQVKTKLKEVSQKNGKNGVYYSACCPCHADKTPSLLFGLDAEEMFWAKCKSAKCGAVTVDVLEALNIKNESKALTTQPDTKTPKYEKESGNGQEQP